MPESMPNYRTRSQRFDAQVLAAYAPIQQAFPRELANLDVAVDTVPRMQLGAILPPEIVADGRVPLGRLIPAGIDRAGAPRRPRIVIFRKPVEQRVPDRDRAWYLRGVLGNLVATYLNVDPQDIDPDYFR